MLLTFITGIFKYKIHNKTWPKCFIGRQFIIILFNYLIAPNFIYANSNMYLLAEMSQLRIEVELHDRICFGLSEHLKPKPTTSYRTECLTARRNDAASSFTSRDRSWARVPEIPFKLSLYYILSFKTYLHFNPNITLTLRGCLISATWYFSVEIRETCYFIIYSVDNKYNLHCTVNDE